MGDTNVSGPHRFILAFSCLTSQYPHLGGDLKPVSSSFRRRQTAHDGDLPSAELFICVGITLIFGHHHICGLDGSALVENVSLNPRLHPRRFWPSALDYIQHLRASKQAPTQRRGSPISGAACSISNIPAAPAVSAGAKVPFGATSASGYFCMPGMYLPVRKASITGSTIPRAGWIYTKVEHSSLQACLMCHASYHQTHTLQDNSRWTCG